MAYNAFKAQSKWKALVKAACASKPKSKYVNGILQARSLDTSPEAVAKWKRMLPVDKINNTLPYKNN